MSGALDPRISALLAYLQQAQNPVMAPVQPIPQDSMMSSLIGAAPSGYLSGQTHFDPSIAPQVTAGAARPFAPGEYLRNPDGSWSSELSMTVAHPDLNRGQPSVIPSLWIAGGRPYAASTSDEAVRLARQSGLPFPSFGSLPAAEQFADRREASWQGINNDTIPQDARKVQPLWTFPQGYRP